MKIKNFLENFILVAIVLVIVQTFLQELSAYNHWTVFARHGLIIAGLVFDLIFSIEFIVRSIASGRSRHLLRYWLYERGWVDFLSSLPLLIFDSGPSVFILLAGAPEESASTIGVLNVLKVVKAVRVTRILRLVRIIKIFGKIHNAESPMAQHHTASISTTAVFTIVITLVSFALFTDTGGHGEILKRGEYYSSMACTIRTLSHEEGFNTVKALNTVFKDDPHVLYIYRKDKLILEKMGNDEFLRSYTSDDFVKAACKEYSLVISITDIHRHVALQHMESFFIIVLIVFAYMLFYTRHFVQTISDVIHIMNKGFRKKNYNLQVKIREEYAGEEIYRLAKFYNDAYLPSKAKWIHDSTQDKKSALSMNDLMKFNKKQD